MSDEKSKAEEMLKAIGLTLSEVALILAPEVAKQLEPAIAQSAAKTINEMKLPDLIVQTIDQQVKTQTDAIGAEVKAALAQMTATRQAAPQPDQPLRQGITLQDIIAGIAALKGGGDGMAGVAQMFKGMQTFMEMTATMYQGPRLAAQKELLDILKGGYSIGMDTKQVLEGAEKGVNKGLDALVKPTTQP